jgi:hypothetical protein
MFPWSPEFIWDAAHVAFFGAFYAVVMVVGGMLVTAALRARRGLGHAEAVAWHADFEDLPASARACRHQLTGEAPGRTCDNGFDCRKCAVHPAFIARKGASCEHCATMLAPGTISSAAATSLPTSSEPTVTVPASVQTALTAAPRHGRSGGRPAAVLEPNAFVEQFGLSIPLDRYYHRGHTWVRPEADGTVTFGLDALGQRLVGTPERLELPAVGAGLTVNGIGCRMHVGGNEVRVLAPVEGEVVAAHGGGADWTLSVRPSGALDLRHLLAGDEVRGWVLREAERLEQVLGLREVGRALADGGELVEDLSRALPRAQFDAVLGEMFLEP